MNEFEKTAPALTDKENEASEKNEIFDKCLASTKAHCNSGAYLYYTEKPRKTDGKSAVSGDIIGVKDNISVKDMPLTCGSKILDGYMASYDATAVKRLKEAGAVIFGKLNLDEFAMGSSGLLSAYKPVKNPFCEDRMSGGSSSGSAVAVCNGSVTAALGTDTGGSIRVPAALCGVVGFKPSYGAVSRYGLTAHASSLDTVGVLAKSVEKCAAVTDVISGKDELDGTTADIALHCLKNLKNGIAGKKVCFLKDATNCDFVSDEVRSRVLSTCSVFEKLGAEVFFDTFGEFRKCVADYYIIASAEASSCLARFDGIKYGHRENGQTVDEVYGNSRANGLGKEVKRRVLFGSLMLSEEYYEKGFINAARHRRAVIDKLNGLFSKYDLLITPTVPTVAPKTSDSARMLDIFTYPANLAGLPAISVPLKVKGLPIGLQLLGRRFADSEVLSAGEAIEKAEVNTDA